MWDLTGRHYSTRGYLCMREMDPLGHQGTEIKINEPFKRVHMVDAIMKYWRRFLARYELWRSFFTALAKERMFSWKHFSQRLAMLLTLSLKNLLKKPWFSQPYLWSSCCSISSGLRKSRRSTLHWPFELFIMTKEYNAFTELNDPIDQLSF